MKKNPPIWADRFLRWYCHPDLLEEIQGDLHELYHYRMRTFGRKYADIKFVWEVLRLLRFPLLKDPVMGDKILSLAASKILSRPSWNDILFETRNKDYGAYNIRNSYGANMIYGFAIVIFIWISIVLWWWIEFKS